ncbi:uncharacterized protein LOC122503577 [Leptopilina heterotoma]|uniref:uncharacterized protein LOC122503577 n=1 Tax=Leptopilina heterotoma TaxID=63436 RepID=UPI001CAA33C1|nr:uncharacterized protein LOC122503577 [Leptopilina heterotoma]
MIKITIISLLISLIYGQICTLTNEEIKQLEKSFIKAKNYMQKEATNEDAAICIGTARAGKSTLINYLMGNELRGVKYSRFGEFKIIKANERSEGPEIGAGPTSKTTIPTKWKSDKLHGLIIFDSPGFQDNRGPVQDITNSFYIYQLVKKVKSLKFILVINFGDIERANIKPFLRLLLDFEKLFENKFQEIFPSISVIVSKTPNVLYETTVDIEMIQYMLRQRVSTTKETSFNNIKKCLDYIMKNSNRIGLFKQARADKIVTSDIDFHIISAINNSGKVEKSVLQNVAPSISDSSLLCLHNAKNEWVSITKIINIQKSISTFFTNMLIEWRNLNKTLDSNAIKKIQTNLSYIEGKLNDSVTNDIDIYENIETIKKIDGKLKEMIDNSSLLRNVELFDFFSHLLRLNESEHLQQSFRVLMLSLHTTVKMEMNEILLLNEKMSMLEFQKKQNTLYKEFNKICSIIKNEIENSSAIANTSLETELENNFCIQFVTFSMFT